MATIFRHLAVTHWPRWLRTASGRGSEVPMVGVRRAVVLLSGGIDSSVAAAVAKADGLVTVALSIDYGQRRQHALRAASRVAESLRLEGHRVVRVDLRQFGGSALTSEQAVPTGQDPSRPGIPPTYVPARNTIFLSLALAWA